MLASTPKLRTGIAMLAAAVSVAVMTTTAQAKPIWQVVRAGVVAGAKDKQDTCDALQGLFGYDVEHGNSGAAHEDYLAGNAAGCAWAP